MADFIEVGKTNDLSDGMMKRVYYAEGRIYYWRVSMASIMLPQAVVLTCGLSIEGKT